MRDELGFQGSQLNQINTCFTVGYVTPPSPGTNANQCARSYVLGQVPSNLALQHVKPRIWFPLMMVLWGGLTMVTASVRNPQSIMAIRFFQGICEASTFVGTHYILGAWYTERELGKRSGIFTSSGLAGTMIGGFIQSGIYRSMDGRHGLSGWRWLFIVDGLLTLPVALYGYLLFPDTPHTTTASYLSPAERTLAVARVPAVERRRPALTLAFARRVLSSWQWWGFVVLWILAGETESFSTNALLALFLQSHPTRTYTVEQMNNYPTGVAAVGIVSTLFWAALTDFLAGKRYLVAYFIGLTGVATSAMILVAARDPASPGSTSVVFAAYYWAGSVYACQATFFAWCNDAMRYEDAVFRAVVLAGMNVGSNAVNAWWSIVFYGAPMAPWFIVRPSPCRPLPPWPCCLPEPASWLTAVARHVGHDCLLHCPRLLERGAHLPGAKARARCRNRGRRRGRGRGRGRAGAKDCRCGDGGRERQGRVQLAAVGSLGSGPRLGSVFARCQVVRTSLFLWNQPLPCPNVSVQAGFSER